MGQGKEPNRGLEPYECRIFNVACVCFGPETSKEIFAGLTELKQCQVALASKDAYIKDRLVTWGAGQPVAFWQTPAFVVGSVVVSVGVTAGLTAWLLRR